MSGHCVIGCERQIARPSERTRDGYVARVSETHICDPLPSPGGSIQLGERDSVVGERLRLRVRSLGQSQLGVRQL